MKFTKEEAVEKLNHHLTLGGKKPLRMSERTLDSVAETLLACLEGNDYELEDFVQRVMPLMGSINSNLEHDYSQFVRSNAVGAGTRCEAQGSGVSGARRSESEGEGLLDALSRRVEELESAQERRLLDEALERKRAALREYLSRHHVCNQGWVDDMMTVLNVGVDDDVEECGKTILSLYTGAAGARPAPLGRATVADSGQDVSFSELKALRRSRQL